MRTMNFNEMENVQGGRVECDGLSEGLGGAALIFGVASWWTGVGAGIALAISAAAYAADLAGC
ncbi:hypothetical protein PP180_11285 [Muricauda sp. SK9]|uniref:hypothetical protein n=1 Tax=Flavobacteriaceae TaxID=49546 RepID=UPI0011C4796B|nr:MULTISPECIES: hypothetical protein [Allomuricauda]MDC6385952.1 hypothetical protein [Muricauda sp. SK9]